MRGRWIAYSAEEEAWIIRNGTLTVREFHAAFCAAFGRADISAVNLVSKRKRMGVATGRTGRFEKGIVPANKGQKMPWNANSAATRFKPGNRTGRANYIYKPIGTERVAKGGYLQRKIHDGMPLQSRWRFVHLINWEAVNGPLPKGHALKCLDGDRTNVAAENWEMVSRAMLPRLAGGNGRGKRVLAYDEAPAELRPAIMAVARLQAAAKDARRTP